MKGIFFRLNLALLLVVLVCVFLGDSVQNAVLTEKEVASFYHELFKGPFYAIEYYLQHEQDLPPREQIKELQDQFGFGVALVAPSELSLTRAEQRQLERGEILSRDAGERFYRQLSGSELLMRLGPFAEALEQNLEIKKLEHRQKMVLWLFVIVLTSLTSLLWSFPFWKNLRSLMRATERFGRGDFSSRAVVSRRSALRPMAETFNQMGSRIEELISAQKGLLHAVSHELRTPIARARFALVMLEEADERQQLKEYTDMLYGDMEDLEGLISELLTYCTLEEQGKPMAMEAVAAQEWLTGLRDKLEPLRGDTTLSLDLQKAPQFLRIHPRFMSRAVENLLLNAIRYARGEVRIAVAATASGWQLSVCDDGPGIPVADRERIFQPFVRLDDSRNRESGGAGLGLAIVQQIVANHGGQISISDREGPGACFVISIPAQEMS